MLSLLAAEAAESSKTLFYVLGGLLAGWAVVLTVLGMSRADFPTSDSGARGVMAITAVFVVAAMAAAVITG
ncbi:MAG TPA: hypothetical protein VFB41_06285 [Solirubrobacteraceae bacterium]|nr:hypothetical protein [Solirubrobacteraceae bacterium]